MSVTLLEALQSIPDHRRAEGKRFDLATVLLYAILGMVAGANSYRQMHEFIRILQRDNYDGRLATIKLAKLSGHRVAIGTLLVLVSFGKRVSWRQLL